MFSSIGIPEIIIILSVVLLLFGGRKIPQLARDLGAGIREFKRSLTNAKDGNLELEDHVHTLDEESIVRHTGKKNARKGKKTKTKKKRS